MGNLFKMKGQESLAPDSRLQHHEQCNKESVFTTAQKLQDLATVVRTATQLALPHVSSGQQRPPAYAILVTAADAAATANCPL